MKTQRNRSNKHSQTKKAYVYNKTDYKSNDGMLTSVWGPGLWHTLHTMSFNYPVSPTLEDKTHYRDFILNLQNVLPCGKCRKNLKMNFKKLPLKMSDMNSRETFSKYIYRLHELINRMLGKQSGLSYNDVRERYEHFRSRCHLDSLEKENKDKTPDKKSELGCTVPVYGEKSKCILKIVPQTTKCETLQIDKKCIGHKLLK
jgi:hypothetical protein